MISCNQSTLHGETYCIYHNLMLTFIASYAILKNEFLTKSDYITN